MRVIYAGVDLGVLELYAYDWEPVYDDTGVDYLYTKVTIVVRAMINGQAEVLTPTQGEPFNGPAISYAFKDLAVPPPKPKQTPFQFVASSPLFTIDRNVVRQPESHERVHEVPSDVQGKIPVVPEFMPAKRLPPARAAQEKDEIAQVGTVPAQAVRQPPGRVETDVKTPLAPLNRINVSPSLGLAPPSTKSPLRQIVRVPNTAPLTHITIRHRLGTPRGRLYIFAGPGQEIGKPRPGSEDRPEPPAQLMLEAPQDKTYQTDCRNGPTPKVLGVYSALGDANTLLVDWQCTAYVNEGPLNSVAYTGALLSNRFSQTHHIAADGYTTIGTAGTTVFRTDFVHAQPITPDLLRPVLFLPVPQGFTRQIDYVTGRSDVTGVDYAYTDTQVSSNFVAGVYCNAAGISAVHRQAVVSGDILTGALTTYERVLNLMAQRKWAKPDREPRRDDLVPRPMRPRGPMGPRA